MFSKYSLVLGVAAGLFCVVKSESTLGSRDEPDPCTFEGNADFYGIGVRIGFYLTWISGLLTFVLNPRGCDVQAIAQTAFLLANLIAVSVLQVQQAATTNVVVPILLFYMFFGGSVIGITSAMASIHSWKDANATKKIEQVARQVFVQLTFVGTLIYSFYFWTRGYKYFKSFPAECGGTFVFPAHNRVSLSEPSAGSVLGLLLLVLLYLLIALVSYKRLRMSYGLSGLNPITNSPVIYADRDQQSTPLDKSQRTWTILGGILIAFVLLWSILGIELTLKWNRVTGVNYLGVTGQLIPFIVGLASFPSALWDVVEYWQDVRGNKSSDEDASGNEFKFPDIHVAPQTEAEQGAQHPLLLTGTI